MSFVCIKISSKFNPFKMWSSNNNQFGEKQYCEINVEDKILKTFRLNSYVTHWDIYYHNLFNYEELAAFLLLSVGTTLRFLRASMVKLVSCCLCDWCCKLIFIISQYLHDERHLFYLLNKQQTKNTTAPNFSLLKMKWI